MACASSVELNPISAPQSLNHPNHHENLIQKLKQFYENDTLVDVSLRSQGNYTLKIIFNSTSG